MRHQVEKTKVSVKKCTVRKEPRNTGTKGIGAQRRKEQLTKKGTERRARREPVKRSISRDWGLVRKRAPSVMSGLYIHSAVSVESSAAHVDRSQRK